MDIIDEIKQLKILLDEGAINEEEFQMLKKEAFERISATSDVQKKENNPEKNNQQKKTENTVEQSLNNENPIKKESKADNSIVSEFESGNELTVNLLKTALGLSLIMAVVFWIRYDSFIAFLIMAVFSVLAILGSGKVNKFKIRNLYLGLMSIILFLLIIIPIGKTSETTNSSDTSSSNDTAVLHCKYCKKTIYEKGNQGIICYTDEPDGCGVVQFYSGTKYAFCSQECRTFYRAIK